MATKLINVQRNPRDRYLLNRILNNKKMPLIPPLFRENKLMEILKKKPNFSFFAKHHSLIKNNSKFPSYIYSSILQYLTDNRLSSISFSQDHTAKKIKTYGHDNSSIRMLKICGSSIY